MSFGWVSMGLGLISRVSDSTTTAGDILEDGSSIPFRKSCLVLLLWNGLRLYICLKYIFPRTCLPDSFTNLAPSRLEFHFLFTNWLIALC